MPDDMTEPSTQQQFIEPQFDAIQRDKRMPYRLFNRRGEEMKAKERKTKLIMFFMCSLLLTAFLSAIPVCMADDHKGSEKLFDKHGHRKGEGVLGGLLGRGHDEGNETTGQIVAWSLAAANLTVALSLIIRGVKQFAPLNQEVQSSLTKFNSIQKKCLMRFHYILNPVILLLAILHWTLSRCKSTALPEWGLLTMGAIVSLGIILRFKLCPRVSLRNVYKVHTQPVLFLILISMLVIGHLSMD
jgi:hypothetical protein